MLLDLSKLTIKELFKLYNAVGWTLFVKVVLPLIFIFFVIYCILWLTDKKMC